MQKQLPHRNAVELESTTSYGRTFNLVFYGIITYITNSQEFLLTQNGKIFPSKSVVKTFISWALRLPQFGLQISVTPPVTVCCAKQLPPKKKILTLISV
ncbi:MAG: hypothetical protein CM15mP59_5450 [Flavobacteriaceae bacterium]|nr:MAG: hypothetical protein CM15mP59_5450 [Flavobacteriaceae bacterium]